MQAAKCSYSALKKGFCCWLPGLAGWPAGLLPRSKASRYNGTMKTLLLLLFIAFPAFASDPFQAADSVYIVQWQSGNTLHTGTGVLIAPDKILTNCHVLAGTRTISLIHDKTKQVFSFRSYRSFGGLDVCLIQGGPYAGTPSPVNPDYKIGQTVWIYGYPQQVLVYGFGPIMGLVKTDQGMVFESGVFCDHGSSGGPVFNVKGELIALNFGVRASGNVLTCLSIPAFSFISYL